jgi:hypothetical protein
MRPAKALLVDDRRDNLIALEAMLQGLPWKPFRWTAARPRSSSFWSTISP